MTKITIEIERACGHECDEIRCELSEALQDASLYESRYRRVASWICDGLPPLSDAVWACKDADELAALLDKQNEEQLR